MRIIERVLFAIACLGAALTLLWQILAFADRVFWPHDARVLTICAVVVGCLLTLTFQRHPLGDPWKPVLRVTRASLVAARAVLTMTVILVAGFILFALVSGLLAWPSFEFSLFLVITGIPLLGFVYMALHWGLRPNNLFSDGFLGVVTDFPFISRRHRPLR